MIQKISDQFAILETTTHRMLEGIAKFNSEQQNFKSDADTWSMLEVVEHLVKIGNVMRYYPFLLSGAKYIPPSKYLYFAQNKFHLL